MVNVLLKLVKCGVYKDLMLTQYFKEQNIPKRWLHSFCHVSLRYSVFELITQMPFTLPQTNVPYQ